MPQQHNATPTSARARVSRRRFLTVAGALGAYSLTHADHALAHTPAGARATSVNKPAVALSPALRVALVDEPEPPGPDESEPPDVDEFEPPGPDQILFPIVVGPEDYCYVTDSFGDCRDSGCSRSHAGVDIMADQGLPIRATVNGRLTKRYVDTGKTYGAGHGWTLVDESANVTWKYFHMGRHEENLEVGDEVVQGQIIGYVGNTGTSGVLVDTNYHLHLEYRPDGVATNPFPLLQRDPDVIFES